jgi:hypothetical protein
MISVVLGPLERVVGTGWTWLHALLMMTKNKKAWGFPCPAQGLSGMIS